MGDFIYDPAELAKLTATINDMTKLQEMSANKLLGLQISNAQKLLDKQLENMNKAETTRLAKDTH